MAGNTSRIDATTLRVQWDSYVPLQVIAAYWTVSVHQLVRLRVAWNLEPRNDRKRRYKPTRLERMLDPDADELAASESTLDLAPMVAERVTVVQASWTPAEWQERKTVKPEPFRLARLVTPEEAVDLIDEINRESMR